MKIRITQFREVIYEPNLENYPEHMRTTAGVIATEKENAAETPEFMDMLDATDDFTFEVIEE